MSIDSFIEISIETQSLSMAQKGFGTPILVGAFDHLDDWRVHSFSDISELLEWEKKLSEKQAESGKERLKETAIYNAAEEIQQTDRDQRVLPKVRFGGRLAGAIHQIEIQGVVTV